MLTQPKRVANILSLRRLNTLLPLVLAAREHGAEKLPAVAALDLHNFLRRALRDDLAAAVAAFGA